MFWRMIGLLLAVAVSTIADAALAAEARLQSHRAAYVLTLGSAKSSGVSAIDGVMTIDWQETCDGWTMSQRMRFQLFDADGEAIESDITFSSWEAFDGTRYRFTMRSQRDGDTVEELRGRALIGGPGKGGKAVFTQPADEVLELPPGTLFPTEHSLLLIDRARAGDRSFARAVFDGASVDGAMDVNAVIGPVLAPGEDPTGPQIARQLLAGESWRVRLAFFRGDDRGGSEPEYETSMRMYANGVGTEFLFDYPEFSIKGRLQRLDAVPAPRC
jgi:hypothetical protein